MDQLLSRLPQAERELLTKFADVRVNGMSEQLEQLQKQSLQMLLTQYKMVTNAGDAIVGRLVKQTDQSSTHSQQALADEYLRLAQLRDAVVAGMGDQIEELQKQSLLTQRVEYELMAKLRDATVEAMERQLQQHRQQEQLLRIQQTELERLAIPRGETPIRDERNFAFVASPPSSSTDFLGSSLATADPMMQAQTVHDQANLAQFVAACLLDHDLSSAPSEESRETGDLMRKTSPPSGSVDVSRNHLETNDQAVAQARLRLSQATSTNAVAVCKSAQKMSALALGPYKKWSKKKSKWVDVLDDSDSGN